MKWKKAGFTIRELLFYFGLIWLLLFLIFLFLNLNHERITSIHHIETYYSDFATTASKRQQTILEATKKFLVDLSQTPPLQNLDLYQSQRFLSFLQSNHPYYSNIYIVGLNGKILASTSTNPPSSNQTFNHTNWFEEVIRSKTSVITSYQVSPITKTPVLFVVCPILDIKQNLKGVIIAEESLYWLISLIKTMNLPSDNVITITDHHHEILFSYSNGLDYNEENQYLPSNLHYTYSDGKTQIVKMNDFNNKKWLLVVTPIQLSHTMSDIYLYSKTPLSSIYGPVNNNMLKKAVLYGLPIIFLIWSYWFLMKNLVIIPVEQLNQVAVGLIKGNYTGRMKPPFRFLEHSRLAEMINLTMSVLEKRERDLQRDTKKSQRYTWVLKKLFDDTIHTMSTIIEASDQYTSIHQKRVSELTISMAKELGLNQREIDGLRIASLLHDIGKLSIPNEILTKKGSLSDLEYQIIHNHPLDGYRFLKKIRFRYPVALIVYQHHERLNGSGYPLGIKSNNIHYGTKILMVADVVEAMVSHRPYRNAPGLTKALEELTKNRGILYDEKVVDCCINLFKEKGFHFSHSYNFYNEEN
jgi:putative nucleotidyltransferase with HDIG domain